MGGGARPDRLKSGAPGRFRRLEIVDNPPHRLYVAPTPATTPSPRISFTAQDMSAHQGDFSPDVFVFPPFAPPTARPEATPAPVTEPAAEPEPPAAPEPEPFGFEVPLPAHDVGDPEAEAPVHGGSDALPWDFTGGDAAAPAAGLAEGAPDEADLPWLEMPDGGPTIHSTEEAAAPEPPAADSTWMAWESEASSTGTTAAEITPPPLATAGELTSVSAVPSPASEAVPGEPPPLPEPEVPAVDPYGFTAADPYAPTTEPVHPETMPGEEPPAPAHSWPVEAMEPAALQAAEAAPVVETPVAADAVAAHVPAIDHDAFGRVAERLEAAARALRTDPGGFLATHHDDPLALLIAGYALGYRQGSRAAE